MGIAINRPLGLNLGEVFEQLALQYSPQTGAQALLCGGPVETQQGFVLHHPGKKQWQSTVTITENICLTTSRDILDDMADEQGPDNTLVALGYAGWMGGQLEQELLDNAWLTVPAQAAFLSELLFQCALENRASLAAASIGVDLSQLSNSAGHA